MLPAVADLLERHEIDAVRFGRSVRFSAADAMTLATLFDVCSTELPRELRL